MKKRVPAPSDIADKFMLRLPDGMRGRIREAAGKNCRSMNAEIIAALEKLFPQSEKEIINSALRTVFSAADKAECLAKVKKVNQIAENNGELIRFIAAPKGDNFVIVPYNMVFDKK